MTQQQPTPEGVAEGAPLNEPWEVEPQLTRFCLLMPFFGFLAPFQGVVRATQSSTGDVGLRPQSPANGLEPCRVLYRHAECRDKIEFFMAVEPQQAAIDAKAAN